jgi:AcrR family transcriptional regulator
VSENRQETRARILERARILFNAQGIDNVGVRDLARDLDMSPGNLSYHFTRKEELVRALLEALRDRNAARPTPDRVVSVEGLLIGFRAALLAQLEYRCLTESIVHVVRTWPELAGLYRETELRRRADLAAAVRRLVDLGALTPGMTEVELARLVATWTLVARFWLAERGISYPGADPTEAVGHYLALVAHSLVPYVPSSGRAALEPWLAGVLVDASLGRATQAPPTSPS